MSTNDDIANALVSHQIGVQRLSTATVRKILALLKRSDVRLIERLSREGTTELGRRRLERLIQDIRRIVESAHTDALGELVIDLNAFGEYEVDYQLDMFKATVPVQLDFVRPSADQIVAAVNSRPFQGRILKDWFKELSEGSFRRLRNTIRVGVVEGRTIDQLVREIRGTRAQGFKDGILQVNRRAAEATVRTAVAHTNNAARDALYKRNTSLIEGLEWSATLDGRTSAVCRGRDGKVFPVDKGPRPPAHPNCRSSMAPVLKSWKSLGIDLKEAPKGTRASLNGQVSADFTYGDWLKRQPIEVQDDILGVTKGRLFRKGGLSMDRFIDRKGQELTLDQLRAKEADAWRKAGLS